MIAATYYGLDATSMMDSREVSIMYCFMIMSKLLKSHGLDLLYDAFKYLI